MNPGMSSLFAPAVNLSLLVGVLFYFLRLPIRDFIGQRHKTWSSDLQSARELLKSAQDSYEEYTAKLNAVDVELQAIRESARREAAQTRDRIVLEARNTSTRLLSDSRSLAQNVFVETRRLLMTELGSQVVARSELLLNDRLTPENRKELRSDFARKMEVAG